VPTYTERDACGIGFVADARGGSSHAILQAALQGLSCVTHRGAVMADAKTSDGSGVLAPIPPRIFGEGHGVAMLFVRGDDPRADVEAAAGAEGLHVMQWRTPPTDDGQLGDLAIESRPRIVQAVLAPAHDRPDEELERAAYRLRRRIQATTEGTYVASCSFRTVLYKGLVAAEDRKSVV
jgi:glutamate synthase domain-containing protein 1